MDARLQARLAAAVERQGVRAFAMASGAGHDAAVFAGQGIPTAMLFVRNQNGSHNPDEAMDLGDFAVGVRVAGEVVGATHRSLHEDRLDMQSDPICRC